jgi:phage gp45-like
MWPDNIPFIMEGQVVDTNDPNQMGRVRAWIPALDGEDFNIQDIPWAEYASPFFGFTVAYPGGETTTPNYSDVAYGFWAIPKVGATVCIFCMNGSPQSRYYFASTLRLHRNRSLPAGRNVDFNNYMGPWGDSGDGEGNLNPVQPAYDNLRTQFQNKITQSEAITRGAYERNVAQGADVRNGEEGYSISPADSSYLDPQTYCLVTPGRNAIIMQDDPHFARLRLKTAEGHQIIFDDANERIYVSTSKGNTWLELDQDGHINIFGTQSISFRTGSDFNIFADGNINLEAGNGINLRSDKNDIRLTAAGNYQVQAAGNILETACGIFDITAEKDIHISAVKDLNAKSSQGVFLTGGAGVDVRSGKTIKLTASSDLGLGAGGNLIASGSNIYLNSGSAPTAKAAADSMCAEQATSPSVIPGFEPWTRPISETTRGPFWKP